MSCPESLPKAKVRTSPTIQPCGAAGGGGPTVMQSFPGVLQGNGVSAKALNGNGQKLRERVVAKTAAEGCRRMRPVIMPTVESTSTFVCPRVRPDSRGEARLQ